MPPYDLALSTPVRSTSMLTTTSSSPTMVGARTSIRHGKGPTEGASASTHDAYDDDEEDYDNDDYDEIGMPQLGGALFPTQGDEQVLPIPFCQTFEVRYLWILTNDAYLILAGYQSHAPVWLGAPASRPYRRWVHS